MVIESFSIFNTQNSFEYRKGLQGFYAIFILLIVLIIKYII